MLSMYFQGWERYIERMFIYCGYELKFYLGNFVKKQKKLKKKNQKNTYLKHYIIEKKNDLHPKNYLDFHFRTLKVTF